MEKGFGKFGAFGHYTSESIAQETNEAYAEREALKAQAAKSLFGFALAKLGGEAKVNDRIAFVDEIAQENMPRIQAEAESYVAAYEEYQKLVDTFSSDLGVEARPKEVSDFVTELWQYRLSTEAFKYVRMFGRRLDDVQKVFTQKDAEAFQALNTVLTQKIPAGTPMVTKQGTILSQNETFDIRKDITLSFEEAKSVAQERGIHLLIKVDTYVRLHTEDDKSNQSSQIIEHEESYIVPSEEIIVAIKDVGGRLGSDMNGLYFERSTEPFFTEAKSHEDAATQSYSYSYNLKLVPVFE